MTTPPNLREAAINSQQRCVTCVFYRQGPQQHGTCEKFGAYGVDDDDTCDAWESTKNEKGVMPTAAQHIIRVVANPFGGPYDGKDAHGQWYSPKTNFWDDKAPPFIPAVYYHGRNPDGTPAGVPDFIGKAVKAGVDARGVLYDVSLDPTSKAAQRLAATPSDQIRASSGVIPATKRIAPSGHVDSWMNGEISVFDIDPAIGRMPVNDYAVGTHIKALYQQAGIAMPQVGGHVNPVQQLIDFLTNIMSFLGGNTNQNAPAAQPLIPAATGPGPAAAPINPPAVVAAQGMANSNYQNAAPPPVASAPVGVGVGAGPGPTTSSGAVAPAPADGKNRTAHEHTHDHADGTRHDHPHGHDAGMHIHDHEHAAAPAPAMAAPKESEVPVKLEGKAMTNQVDDSMKALQANLARRIAAEADAWATGLLNVGKMFPAEKADAVSLYSQLAIDGSMKAEGGESEQLVKLKLMMDKREPHLAAGDLDQKGLRAAGFDKPAGAEAAPDQARKLELMNHTLIGRQIVKDGAVRQ